MVRLRGRRCFPRGGRVVGGKNRGVCLARSGIVEDLSGRRCTVLQRVYRCDGGLCGITLCGVERCCFRRGGFLGCRRGCRIYGRGRGCNLLRTNMSRRVLGITSHDFGSFFGLVGGTGSKRCHFGSVGVPRCQRGNNVFGLVLSAGTVGMGSKFLAVPVDQKFSGQRNHGPVGVPFPTELGRGAVGRIHVYPMCGNECFGVRCYCLRRGRPRSISPSGILTVSVNLRGLTAYIAGAKATFVVSKHGLGSVGRC